jgi:hypothetical protein
MNAISVVHDGSNPLDRSSALFHPLLAVVRHKDLRKVYRALRKLQVTGLPEVDTSTPRLDLQHVDTLNNLLEHHRCNLSLPIKPIKVRICLNLSKLLNDYIIDLPFSYISVEDVLALLGPGHFMALIDFRNYFKQLPQDASQAHLLCFEYQGTRFQYRACPFGVKSGPAYASTISAVIASFLKRKGITCLIYIDDMILIAPTRELCEEALQTALSMLHDLGILVSHDKICLPSTSTTFLGFTIDSTSRKISITPEKLEEYTESVSVILSAAKAKQRIPASDLHSLLGTLERISSVFFIGKVHLRLFYQAFPYRHGEVVLNALLTLSEGLLRELEWWASHLATARQESTAFPLWVRSWALYPRLICTWSDASGGGGFGIICNGHVLQGHVNPDLVPASSGYLELVPLLCILRIWGNDLRDSIILATTDNLNNTRSLNKGSCKSMTTHALLHAILTLATSLNTSILGLWASRDQLQLLDDLSKNVLSLPP